MAAKCVAATFVAAHTLPENSRFPISSDYHILNLTFPTLVEAEQGGCS